MLFGGLFSGWSGVPCAVSNDGEYISPVDVPEGLGSGGVYAGEGLGSGGRYLVSIIALLDGIMIPSSLGISLIPCDRVDARPDSCLIVPYFYFFLNESLC